MNINKINIGIREMKIGKLDSIDMEINEGILTLRIDTTTNIGPSASGKTTLIASSGGNAAIQLEDGRQVKLGLNLFY